MTLKIKGSEDESFTINNSFEAECYFQKQAEKFQNRARDAMAVEVPEASPIRELSVKPIAEEEEGHEAVTVRDLSEEPSLAVRPPPTTMSHQIPLSSFEALYDKTQLETVPGTVRLTAQELQDNLGSRFKGTFPDGAAGGMSSFENIYQGGLIEGEPLTEGDFFITAPGVSQGDSGGALPSTRWSAPANTIEPPIIGSEEFAERFGAVQDKIDGHWTTIKDMVDLEPPPPRPAASSSLDSAEGKGG